VAPNFNNIANKLINERRWVEAKAFLQDVIAKKPKDWKPVREGKNAFGDFLVIAFWSREEFLAYVTKRPGQEVTWVADSYSLACYQLAVIAVEEERLEDGIRHIESGLAIEPEHPELWNEQGYILSRLQRYEQALQCYQQAAVVREWAPKEQFARAYRGQGGVLIDLNRLDEAEAAFRRSLELEPENTRALSELEFIDERRKKPAQPLPWFLHSLVNPPTDPLTIELLQQTAGMEPVPGPKTVGSANYKIISDAFLNHGWAGFEQAFDRVISRSRQDYADVKRALLREPIFNLEVHRKMAMLMQATAGKSEAEKQAEIRRLLENA
jgi:tetratricopeptide (TPR) repeat protein